MEELAITEYVEEVDGWLVGMTMGKLIPVAALDPQSPAGEVLELALQNSIEAAQKQVEIAERNLRQARKARENVLRWRRQHEQREMDRRAAEIVDAPLFAALQREVEQSRL